MIPVLDQFRLDGRTAVVTGARRGMGACMALARAQAGANIVGASATLSDTDQIAQDVRAQWASLGVNVNAIAPGYIGTDNTAALRGDPVRSSQILGRIPANRWGEAADLMGAIVFLAAPASRYVHGTVLTVDGGWMGR